MRKLETLRKAAKKIEKQDEIYSIDVSAFMHKGDWEPPHCIPIINENLEPIGIQVVYCYLAKGDGGDYFGDDYLASYSEDYYVPFPKCND